MIVVTAPAGDIGHQVMARLLEAGAPVRVIARDPSKLSEDVCTRVEVVQGSHGDAKVVDHAFAGADALFWLVAADPQAASVEAAFVDFTRPAAAALKTRGVKRIVVISGLGRGTPFADKAGYITGSLAMEDLIASTGVAMRTLTMPSFMDNIARRAKTIKEQGVFSSPISGDLKMPSCATRDIAAVATRWLLDESWNDQKDVAVLGPENISLNEMAAIMSDVLGRPVRFEQVAFEAYKARFVRYGFSEAMAQGMTDMMYAKSHGLDLGVQRTPENTTPTSFRQWCEDILKPAALSHR
ncbi:NmrA family transcriptional regulator [Gluconobacter oxydans]|uniref:NmrA family NAD(P)-binding protein n=1 Tax=Gluconobacter thailandicus TaxID=257438 RepID=UPI0002997596|nr:NAD(P)H-binding protein [Gluconobacter thailandicus]AFW00139.1 NmrA family protein [Gluconobacter oxydans H24]ANQ41075.1 NmrA family transcriptional regulator [Gluconobacter oxydans]